MSETEPIPPTSSVTALRIPIIKKGEYDLWSMKMRQYIAITDHILWDIITNGNQTTTDPASPSVSAPKTSLAANARRNNEKALNILLSAIPDRHLLSFHDAVDARSLWKAIKARFGGNEASKKMQKNLLKQQFETFTIGSREELDSAYKRFQHILSMLELHDATVSIEDANLKFLRSLPSVWHVVATMIRGQPGLDELDFDDLYNNLKVYEHELKGVSNSSSPNIAFMSTEVKGSTLKQSTAEPAHIPKGYTQAISSKVPTAPNCASHSDEIICSFFAQQASMPTTHDDEDLLQIDEDAMEEIDIRWQVAMITARIRKFMRKTGRSIDLKPKNGITFDKSKIECFNCQKLGHFARECRFAKYQENRANGRNEKRIVAIEDSNSKALVATDNNEDIDWTKEFDAEPVTYAMMALTGVEQDDWSMEFDAEHVHFGQDGLGDFDWSNKADDAPVSLALMATNSEVPYCSKCSKSYKKLLESYQTERDNFQRARTEILGYQMSLESLEVMLKTHEKNEYAWGDKYEQMEYDLKIRDLKLEEKQKELDQALKVHPTVFFSSGSGLTADSSVLTLTLAFLDFGLDFAQSFPFHAQFCHFGLVFCLFDDIHFLHNTNAKQTYIWQFLSVFGHLSSFLEVKDMWIDELAIRNKVVNQEKTKSSQSAIDRNKVIIEDWVDSDDEETDVSESQKTNSQTVVGKDPRSNGTWAQRGQLDQSGININRVNHSNSQELRAIQKKISKICYNRAQWNTLMRQREELALEKSEVKVPTGTFTLSTAYHTLLKVSQALADESWVETYCKKQLALQFKLQDVWVLCDLPDGKRVIGTKWVFRNKRDERGTIIKNKARLVAQGYRQEEGGGNYDRSFCSVARIEAISFFQNTAFASFMGFYCLSKMDVKKEHFYMAKSQKEKHIKPAFTPIEVKSLGKDEGVQEVVVHLYRFFKGHSKKLFQDSDYAGDNQNSRPKLQSCCAQHAFWDSLRDIVLRSTSYGNKLGTNMASAIVGLGQQPKKFNFALMFMNGMLGHISNENNDQDQDDHTTFVYEDFDATDAVTPDLERKSDETEEVIIEEEKGHL
ncbi:ribonuclease H-like domain-containing protein [Tanacetum coccineum]